MKFAEAAAKAGLPAVYGAELSLAEAPVTVLARTRRAIAVCRALLRAPGWKPGKDRVAYPSLDEVARELEGSASFWWGRRR